MNGPRDRSRTDAGPARTVATDSGARAAGAPRQAPEWRRWMEGCGRRVREVRAFLGMSQEHLAKAAGVSQGAVSRLETGRGLATPLLVVLRIDLVLRRELRRLDPTLLSPALRHALASDAPIFSAPEAGAGDMPLTGDPELDELVRLYRQTSESGRAKLLAIVRAALPGLRALPLVIGSAFGALG